MKSAQGFTVSTDQSGVVIEIEESATEKIAWKIAYPEIRRPLKRILLDPGHSLQVPGARSTDGTAKEEDLNLLQAELIAKALMGRARVDIYNPPMDSLQDIGNHASGYDIFVSLHHNSYEGHDDPGCEVLISRDAKSSSRDLAAALVEAISYRLSCRNRGVKEGGWAVLRAAEVVCSGPCVLVESYFLNQYGVESAKKRSAAAAEAIVGVLESMVI